MAEAALVRTFYDAGHWRYCTRGCSASNQDWGADSLTYTLHFRWKTQPRADIVPRFQALEETAPIYQPCRPGTCTQWSDVPEWDAVAALDDYEVTGAGAALAKAKAAYLSIEDSGVYALGACPDIRYQRPFGGESGLKTLETEANAIRAGLLLYHFTGHASYLKAALIHYHAVRKHFLDKAVPLYSVYVFDDGTTCTQLPHRFFASVNGLMIGNGFLIWKLTRDSAYREQALQTGWAVRRYLSDHRGIYENLQAENDVAEPLVESMYDLAGSGVGFARAWILKNAETAISSCSPDGVCGRFFGGPPPNGAAVTAWQANGAIALMIAAASLSPNVTPNVRNGWEDARFVSRRSKLPTSIHFFGSAIALIGTLGVVCCEAGHARVIIDGSETFDRTGIWQNKSSSGRSLPHSTLFAWQWPKAGWHTLTILPGDFNPKEGSSFFVLYGYLVRNL